MVVKKCFYLHWRFINYSCLALAIYFPEQKMNMFYCKYLQEKNNVATTCQWQETVRILWISVCPTNIAQFNWRLKTLLTTCSTMIQKSQLCLIYSPWIYKGKYKKLYFWYKSFSGCLNLPKYFVYTNDRAIQKSFIYIQKNKVFYMFLFKNPNCV